MNDAQRALGLTNEEIFEQSESTRGGGSWTFTTAGTTALTGLSSPVVVDLSDCEFNDLLQPGDFDFEAEDARAGLSNQL